MTPRIESITGTAIELAFRSIPRVLGRSITADDDWVYGPIGPPEKIGFSFYTALADENGLVIAGNDPDAGLLPDFETLRGPGFDPNHVDSRIRDFYKHTARYRLAVDAHWSPVFRPLASLLVATVSRRIAQLNFPLNSRETAAGMTSGIVRLLHAESGQIAFTGWLRTQPATGNIVYVGLYSVARPPGEAGPCVRVIFPLPRGSSMVLLRPTAHPDGSFRLSSDGRRFGDPGYYRIHQEAKGPRRAQVCPRSEGDFRRVG